MAATKRNIVKFKDTTASSAFTIIGISSHENDYRLSWCINEELKLAFSRNSSILKSDGNEFSCFVHQDDNQTLTLISNRCDNGFLLEKHRNLDFILKFEPELNETEISEWLKKLKSVSLISAAFVLPIDKKMRVVVG